MSVVPACELILVRHGETPWNRDRRLQGHIDIELNEEGRRQARAAAVALSREDIGALYSSDLTRARQTADAIARASGRATVLDRDLRERCYGVMEGYRLDELHERFPVEFAAWQAREADAPIERGETLARFHARVAGALERIARAHMGERAVVVCHGGVLDCAYRIATRTPLGARRNWDLLNASINRLGFDGRDFALRQWADVAHLTLAADGTLDEVDRRFA